MPAISGMWNSSDSPMRAAEELGEIGRHGGDLAHHPHRADHRLGETVAAHFREIAAGDDAELGRQRLEQHRDQIGEQHHPEQARSRIWRRAWMLVAKLPGSM